MSRKPRTKISFLAFFLIWAELKGWAVPPLHVEICNWLERFYFNSRNGVLEVFRGAGKSTIEGVYQAWVLYNDPTARFLDQSCDNTTARKLSRDTRGILRRHPLCRGMLPRDDQKVEFINVLGNQDERNPSVSAYGILSNVTSSRATDILFDDVEVPKNIRSDGARELLRERIGEATHILIPGGRKLFVGTPHTHASLYDEKIAEGADVLKIPLFRHHVRYEENSTTTQRHFPFNFPSHGDLYVFLGHPKTGRLLVEGVDYQRERSSVVFSAAPDLMVDIFAGNAWPEYFTRAEIEHRRKECKTLNEWDSQYLLHAKPLHEIRLDPTRIRAYKLEPVITSANDEAVMTLGQTRIVGASAWWDCAVGKKGGDVSAFSVVFTNERGELFWHVCKALLGDIWNQCRMVRDIVIRYQLGSVTVETNGPGGFVPSILRKTLETIECGVMEIPNVQNKTARILAGLEPPISGRFLWAHVDALDVVEPQMRDWQPGIADQKDDYIDSGSAAISQTPVRIGKISGKATKIPHANWRPNSGSFELQIEG